MKVVEALNPRLLALGLSLLVGTRRLSRRCSPVSKAPTFCRSAIPPSAIASSGREMPSHVSSSNSPRVRSASPTTATSGYLPAILKALDVPISSQLLVFSKTSFQATRIYPQSPRALYFNDSVSVGHVRGSDLLEIAATDPDAGVVFFSASLKRRTRLPRLPGTRTNACSATRARARWAFPDWWSDRSTPIAPGCRLARPGRSPPITAALWNSAGEDGT